MPNQVEGAVSRQASFFPGVLDFQNSRESQRRLVCYEPCPSRAFASNLSGISPRPGEVALPRKGRLHFFFLEDTISIGGF